MRNKMRLSAVTTVLAVVLSSMMLMTAYAAETVGDTSATAGNTGSYSDMLQGIKPEDVMSSLFNYYSMVKDDSRYQAIADSEIVKELLKAYESGALKTEDLSEKATEYLRSRGLSDEEIEKLKDILVKTVISQSGLDVNASSLGTEAGISNAASGKDKENAGEDAGIYVVKRGDTLQKIAKKVYGDSGKWKEIYKLNRDTIKNPDRIEIGQKLKLA
ncbi:LysM domain-containing protein [Lachnospiraceae bacterium JC7]|nr:LysM domain-containing protein [Lachnospiraceae bacterium JC7]